MTPIKPVLGRIWPLYSNEDVTPEPIVTVIYWRINKEIIRSQYPLSIDL
jgi:hypothetical protein